MKRPVHRSVLITDAERSQEDQLRTRQIRYVTMMGVRLALLVLGAVLISAQAPLLWLWLPLCAVGMVLLPWLAVLLANDRPPKDRHRLRHRRRMARQAGPDRTLAAEPAGPGTPAGPRTIDAEP